MLHRFLLGASLAVSMGLCAQSQPGSISWAQTGFVPQPNSPPVVLVPGNPYVYIVSGGTYGGMYLTSLGTLPVQNTGISLAGRAGISLEAPLQTGTVSFQPSVVPGMPVYGAPAVAAAMPGYAAPETAVAESGRLIADLGPSYYGDEAAVATGPPPPSLGEVAAKYKAQPPHHVRTFTNEDAHRLASTVKLPGTRPTPTAPQ